MSKTETFNPRRDQTFEAHHSRRKTMFRKVTLALVAAASLSAMALAPTTASAGGFIWPTYHPHHHWGHGFGFGIGYGGGGYDGCYVTRPVMTPFGLRYRAVNICAY
jgi:hypothetical protein